LKLIKLKIILPKIKEEIMKKILVFGAGRSSSNLIKYLLEQSEKYQWKIIVNDIDIKLIEDKTKNHPNSISSTINIKNTDELDVLISDVDIVVSMLPASLHINIAKLCLKHNKNMVTASYISDEMKKLDEEVKSKNLLFLNEIGLDPGIDHLSGMELLDKIRDKGYRVKAFESFTGGLLAPESEGDNPWRYKFTWSPKQVVVSGQGTVKFIQEKTFKYIPYQKLFRRTEAIEIKGYGKFEGYANRDSLKYRSVYGLEQVETLYRGTLRRPGFCRAWDIFVQLGATDDTYQMDGVDKMTHRDFINAFLAYHPFNTVELKLDHYLGIHQDQVELKEKLEWLGIFSNELVGLERGTPADILLHILSKKWTLSAEDKDMIVMWHKLIYEDLNKKCFEIQSSMVVKGDDSVFTAMSKTVGLPVGIAVKLILNGTIKSKGVLIPIEKEIYIPILEELQKNGVIFNENTFPIN
jgi:saccharopine dehydrogenase-like NADP-dependent oxidoreductase